MKVKALIPEIPKRPPCQAVRITRYANDTYQTDKHCKHRASFVVEGRHLCKRHAESAVMKLAIKEQSK